MTLFVRRRWPKVAAAVAAVALVVLAVVLLTRSDGSPGTPTGTAAPTDDDTVVETAEPLTDPPTSPPVAMTAVLSASDGELRTYEGRAVAAAGVPVLRRVGPSVAWVGAGADRVLLVLVATEHPFAFGPQAKLTFTGTVHQASPGAARAFGLSGADAAEFERQGAYVEVTTYTVS